jgi:hypothetical protein
MQCDARMSELAPELVVSEWFHSKSLTLAALRGKVVVVHAFQMRGTPTLVLIGRSGRIRNQSFGLVDELSLGGETARLLTEPA